MVPSSLLALYGAARFGSALLMATRLLLAPPVCQGAALRRKPRHDLLYASASLSRLGIARVNPALGSARFFPYDRPMYYCM